MPETISTPLSSERFTQLLLPEPRIDMEILPMAQKRRYPKYVSVCVCLNNVADLISHEGSESQNGLRFQPFDL